MNSHDRNNRIMELYASGETLEDIAHAAGVSPEQLLAILKQHGGTDSLAARTERPDAKAAVLDAARAEFLNRFGPIAKALALTGSTREQTASRIVLLHPEIDLVRAMEILEESGIVFEQARDNAAITDAELQAGLWFLIGSDRRIESDPERAAIELPDTILEAVKTALRHTRMTPADIATILGVIAATQSAAARNPRMSIPGSRYEELRFKLVTALRLGSSQGSSPWPPTRQMLIDRFGSWRGALDSIGLGPDTHAGTTADAG